MRVNASIADIILLSSRCGTQKKIKNLKRWFFENCLLEVVSIKSFLISFTNLQTVHKYELIFHYLSTLITLDLNAN